MSPTRKLLILSLCYKRRWCGTPQLEPSLFASDHQRYGQLSHRYQSANTTQYKVTLVNAAATQTGEPLTFTASIIIPISNQSLPRIG